jgi:3-methyladenine DNA glycosylase AlkD
MDLGRDDDLWVRRTAILCQLARKGATDVALLADVPIFKGFLF